MGKKRIKYVFGLLTILLFLSGCSSKDKEAKEGPFLFYMNTEGTALAPCEYEIKEKEPLDAVSQMIKELKEPSESVEMKSAIPSDVKVQAMKLEDANLKLNFNAMYHAQDKVTEVLCRAAIVQSVTQIKGIDTVEFFVDSKPLLYKNGDLVGVMSENSFVQNTGNALEASHNATLTLYFANEKGDGLIEEKKNVHYQGNISIERLIIDNLLSGPTMEGARPILPPDLKVLNVSVKEGICYVNFDKHFLELQYDLEPEIVIYGIVNSLVNTGNVSKVQILIDGESSVKYQEAISLNDPFGRNLELIKQQ